MATTRPFDGEKQVQVTRHGILEEAIPHACIHEQGINSMKTDDKTQSKENVIWPSLARKIATGVTVFGACLTQPVSGLMGQIAQRQTLWRWHVHQRQV